MRKTDHPGDQALTKRTPITGIREPGTARYTKKNNSERQTKMNNLHRIISESRQKNAPAIFP